MFEILILVTALGVVGASGAVLKEYQRKRKAKKNWDEFRSTKKNH